MKYKVGNAQHIGLRENQEDFFAFTDPGKQSFIRHGGFLGFVADGMGGMAYGNEASQLAVKNFLRSYEAKAPEESVPDALNRALKQANMALSSLIKEKGMQSGAVGTTLAAVVLHDLDLYWISVGDSRIYLYRNGKLIQLNECHTVANELDRDAAMGKISREEALNAENRDALSSFLGMAELPEIDFSRTAYRLQPDDRVIVCSDGLYNELSDNEIAAEIQANLQETCVNLVEKALAKKDPHQDNVTVIAMGLGEESKTVAETEIEKESTSKVLWIIIAVLAVMIAALLALKMIMNMNEKGQQTPPGKVQETLQPGMKKKPADDKENTNRISTAVENQNKETDPNKTTREKKEPPETDGKKTTDTNEKNTGETGRKNDKENKK